MPEPWKSILDALLGPYGVVVALGVVIFFLWRLFREAQREQLASVKTVSALADAVRDLTIEVRAWRESSRRAP